MVPKYMQVYTGLKDAILSEVYRANEMLPVYHL